MLVGNEIDMTAVSVTGVTPVMSVWWRVHFAAHRFKRASNFGFWAVATCLRGTRIPYSYRWLQCTRCCRAAKPEAAHRFSYSWHSSCFLYSSSRLSRMRTRQPRAVAPTTNVACAQRSRRVRSSKQFLVYQSWTPFLSCIERVLPTSGKVRTSDSGFSHTYIMF